MSSHGPIQSVTFTPDDLNPVNQFLFIGSEDGSITVIDKDPNAADAEWNCNMIMYYSAKYAAAALYPSAHSLPLLTFSWAS